MSLRLALPVRWFGAALALCAASAPRPCLAQLLPDLVSIPAPADNPTPPGDVFTPPVGSSAPAPSTPEIGEWTRTAQAGQTIAVTGDLFSFFTGTDTGKDSEFVLYGQSVAGRPSRQRAAIHRVERDRAAIAMGWEGRAATDSMYLLWAKNQFGYSRPVTINETEAWWIGPDEAARGDTVSVFGRNLSRNGGTTQSWVYLKPSSGAGQWASVVAVHPYKVDFVVPANLANGTYEVWIHNGHGGRYGWSDPITSPGNPPVTSPLTLTVRSPIVYSGPTFNVRDYGATGDGVTDDYGAIIRTVQAVQAYQQANPPPPGSPPVGVTIYVPAGTYVVGGSSPSPGANFLPVQFAARYKGDGPEKSIFRAHPTVPMGWMVRADNGQSYAFEDLTLDGGGKSFTSGKLFLATVGRNVRLHNVHILTSTGQALDTNGTRGVTIQNCLLSAAGSVVFLGAAEQVFIDGTTFVGAQDAGMMLYSWGGEMIRVTNSRGLNASEAVNGGALRFFVGGDPFGGVQRVYLGNNETVDLGPRPESPDNNSGEQILFETSYDPLQDLDPVFFNGSVLSAGADTVTLQGLQTDYTSAFATDMLVVVTGGRGLGQIRRLVHTDTAQGKITVDRPWGVVPNTTSRVFLVRGHDRIVVHANRIDGRTENVTNTRHYASAGVALGLGVTRAIVVDNQFTDVRNAIGLGSHQTHVNEFQPVYSNFFGRNSIRNTRYGIYLIANKSAGIVPNPGPAYLGNIFYGNTFTDVINFGYGEYSVQGARSFDMNVVEGNGGSNLTRAIDFAVRPGDPPDESIPSIDGSSRSNTVVVGNVFMRGSSTGTEGVRGTPSLGLPALRRNLFSGWAAPYASMPATPILEVPSRPIQLISNPGNTQPLVATIPVWNSGPGSLTWVGSKGVPWLTLSSGGTLAGEHSTGVLRITANPSGLTSGTHVAPVGVRVFVNGALVQERVLQLSFTTGCCSAGTSARFMGITDFINDSGTWKGRYGSQGYWIAGESQPSLPSWALASVGVAPRVWEDPSSQTRALQKSTSSTQRIAASFFHPSSFDIQLNVSGGTRQVSLYALDWNFNRSQRIDVIDASTGTVLDSQVLSGFGGGKYLTWMLSGHVILRITRLSGPDAVISGIFFG